MRHKLSQFAFLPLLCTCVGTAFAQGAALPTTQPAMITIVREFVKPGRTAEHARIEAGWPAAFAKGKSPNYYLAFVSLTGANEAWFVAPWASHAVLGDEMKLESSDTVLAAELARLSRADAEVINDVRTYEAMARPDLSHGAFPDLAKQRFWQISIYRVRAGHDADFEAAAKTYGAAAGRAAPSMSYRVYEISAGLPEPTFLVFMSTETYAQFDDMMAAGQKTMQGFTPEELVTIRKLFTDGLVNSETNQYRLDPGMSYVAAETRASDPTFWMPKWPARRP
jgi:hypothetical protein